MNKQSQMELVQEALERPAFWLLAGGAITATMIGFIASKRMGMEAIPFWQLLIIIVVELVAAAVFALKD